MVKNNGDLFDEMIDIFSKLSDNDKLLLENRIKKITVKKNKTIYENRDEGRYIYYLLNGKIKTRIYHIAGNEKVTGIIYAGQFWNTQTLFDHQVCYEYAQVVEQDVSYYKIQKEAIIDLMKKNFSFCEIILNNIGHYIKKIENKIILLHYYKGVKERVIGFLLMLSEESGKKVGYELLVKHSYSHQDIADFIFCTRQSVTYSLNILRREGLIHYERKRILIHDMDGLKRNIL